MNPNSNLGTGSDMAHNQYSLRSSWEQSQYDPQRQQSIRNEVPSAPRLPTPQQQMQYGPPSGLQFSSLERDQDYSQPYPQPLNTYSHLPNLPRQQPRQASPTAVPRQFQEVPQSGQTTRVPTPDDSYPSDDGFFQGPVDKLGYPLDTKVKRSELEHSSQDSLTHSHSPVDTHSIDLEKHGKDKGWDKHTKLPGRKDPDQPYLPYGQRLKHFTWAWYTLTMATGGIATLISIQPHSFPGLITIGAIFYITNLIFFTGITMTMILRFTKFPGSLKGSITHEREGLFLGPFFLSIATIITGTQKYVIEAYEANHPTRNWAITTIAVAFWAYTFATFCLATFQYSFLFCCHTYKLTSFMPSWLLPIFPVMLSGTIASVIAKDQPIASRMPIIVAGLGCQGLGFTVAILMYAHYIGRLMQVGYPDREHRGAMFIGVGPPSFTCLALIGMANALPDDFDLQGDGLVDAKLLRTMALVVALFLWVLAMWFFMITLVAVINSWAVYFHLGWWAMVFPNTGFVIATISIGNSLQDNTILFVGNGLTVAIVAMWVFVLFNHVRAVYVADIMYPGLDEDIADH
ncbi:Nn.00g055960.m01.CDS01 [Neocucurbitaria sp. VM-36]